MKQIVIFFNYIEIIEFQAKDSEILATPLCLGNISKEFGDILDIHKYSIKKNGIA